MKKHQKISQSKGEAAEDGYVYADIKAKNM